MVCLSNNFLFISETSNIYYLDPDAVGKDKAALNILYVFCQEKSPKVRGSEGKIHKMKKKKHSRLLFIYVKNTRFNFVFFSPKTEKRVRAR